MTPAVGERQRAFAVWWQEMDKWDALSAWVRFGFHCQYTLTPLKCLFKVRWEQVPNCQEDVSMVDRVSFDGEVFAGKKQQTLMDQYIAFPGDIIVSKIRARQGSIGIVKSEHGKVSVTIHYRVLVPDNTFVNTEYAWLALRSQFCRAQLLAATGGAMKGEISEEALLDIELPTPPLSVQQAIVAHWAKAQSSVSEAENQLITLKQRVNDYLQSLTVMEPCERRALALTWDALESWDVKSSRAAAFKLANPSFKPLNEYAEEATELVRPKLEPEKDWPVYGVNNKEGVFFSDYQKGADFNAPYKRIRKGWFFHNPTRSSVGSLGIVPEVPEDAITSPEYQVWRIHNGLLTGFVAVMITTEYFIKLIQFNRVGAVKQRLYVENLLSIPIPEIPEDFQREVAVEREKALAAIVDARAKVAVAAIEVEAMILGTRPVEIPSSSVGRANGC